MGGDSGGPFTTPDPDNDDRDTLIGLVSAGKGCGTGVPTWNTRLSYHKAWFNCIIDKTTFYLNVGTLNKTKVMEDCIKTAKPAPTEPNNDSIIGGDDDKMKMTNEDDGLFGEDDGLFGEDEPENEDDGLFGDDEPTNEEDGLFGEDEPTNYDDAIWDF